MVSEAISRACSRRVAGCAFSSAVLDRLDLHLELARELDHVAPCVCDGLTLLDSSTPEASVTVGSASARRCRRSVRNRPSSPRSSCVVRRIHELDAADVGDGVAAPGPCGTTEIVPSRADVDLSVYGGTLIGPPSPSTGRPRRVVSRPSAVDVQSPARVYASLPSGALHRDPAVALAPRRRARGRSRVCAPARSRTPTAPAPGVDARGIARRPAPARLGTRPARA